MREPRTEKIDVRITKSGREAVDKRRGFWSRGQYVREALKIAIAADLHGPSNNHR